MKYLTNQLTQLLMCKVETGTFSMMDLPPLSGDLEHLKKTLDLVVISTIGQEICKDSALLPDPHRMIVYSSKKPPEELLLSEDSARGCCSTSNDSSSDKYLIVICPTKHQGGNLTLIGLNGSENFFQCHNVNVFDTMFFYIIFDPTLEHTITDVTDGFCVHIVYKLYKRAVVLTIERRFRQIVPIASLCDIGRSLLNEELLNKTNVLISFDDLLLLEAFLDKNSIDYIRAYATVSNFHEIQVVYDEDVLDFAPNSYQLGGETTSRGRRAPELSLQTQMGSGYPTTFAELTDVVIKNQSINTIARYIVTQKIALPNHKRTMTSVFRGHCVPDQSVCVDSFEFEIKTPVYFLLNPVMATQNEIDEYTRAVLQKNNEEIRWPDNGLKQHAINIVL